MIAASAAILAFTKPLDRLLTVAAAAGTIVMLAAATALKDGLTLPAISCALRSLRLLDEGQLDYQLNHSVAGSKGTRSSKRNRVRK